VVNIAVPLHLALESTGLAATGQVPGLADGGSAELILCIDSGGHTPPGLWAQVQGPCSAQLLGGLVDASFFLDSHASVGPATAPVPGEPDTLPGSVVVHLGLGLHLAVGWLLDIDIDADWTWTTRLAPQP
jgi:hypothetical protein